MKKNINNRIYYRNKNNQVDKLNSRLLVYRRILILIALIAFSFVFILENQITNENDNENIESFNTMRFEEVYVSGDNIGLYLRTQGVMVIAQGIVSDHEGVQRQPCDNKIKEGDYIVKVNDIDVSSKSQLIFLINKYGNDKIIIRILRNEAYIDIEVSPVKVNDNEYKLGLWVRDDTQGVGTLTYITKDKQFGALGHGINDVDTGELLSSKDGLLYKANIWGVIKGESGKPGGICGNIIYENEYIIGSINKNCEQGIYGYLEIIPDNTKLYKVALKSEVKLGEAKIVSKVSGTIKEYIIKIVEIYNKTDENSKGMKIEVTDNELIQLTGGIVQGMSGSPIIQNGKFIGAVTHVFVNNPTKGYAIFAETMLEQKK